MPRRVMRRAGGPRRRTIWARQVVNETGITTGVTRSIDLLAPYLASTGSVGVGLTVTRVIMHLQLGTGATLSAGVGVLGGLVVSEELSPTPPDPILNGSADWMDYYWYRAVSPGATGVDGGADLHTSYDRDIHSQRRVDETGQTLFLVLAGTAPSPGPVAVRGYVSTLLKLP